MFEIPQIPQTLRVSAGQTGSAEAHVPSNCYFSARIFRLKMAAIVGH